MASKRYFTLAQMNSSGNIGLKSPAGIHLQDETIPSTSLATALSVPLEVLVSRVRNRREAELMMDIEFSAGTLDDLINTYETIASTSQVLQDAWDALWLAQEPLIVSAIPLIGREISHLNWARAILMKKMDFELQEMQTRGKALLHFADVNSTVAEELQLEGVDRLASEKLSLVATEQGLEQRIRSLLDGSAISCLRFSGFNKSRPLASPITGQNLDTRITESSSNRRSANFLLNGSIK